MDTMDTELMHRAKKLKTNEYVKVIGLSPPNSEDMSTSQGAVENEANPFQPHIDQLREMFSDMAPDFAAERANEIAGNQEKFETFVCELTSKSYPKMKDYLKKQKALDMKRKFIDGLDMEEFFSYFKYPETVYGDTSKPMNQMYRKNAREQLMMDLPKHSVHLLNKVLKRLNYHYLPSLLALKKTNCDLRGKRAQRKNHEELDDDFVKERCYAKMENKVKAFLKKKEKLRKLAFQKAKFAGELKECPCCYDNEVMQIDMSACTSSEISHYFCNNCIRSYCEERIGQGRINFPCLDGVCESSFSLSTLQPFLKSSVFSNLLLMKQPEDVTVADNEELVLCPFCRYLIVMTNKEDKVVKCLNPNCLMDSCRLCKARDHIPLRCDELENEQETDARLYLEKEMSCALIRECHKCKLRFIIEDGCNYMTCSCGARMCYVCKKPLDVRHYDGFSHFGVGKDKCPGSSDAKKLHILQVRKRAKEVKKNLDPNIKLKYDPTKNIK